MNKLRMAFIILFSLTITTSCGVPNVLTDYSKTDSDAALYLDAKTKIDSSDWDGAITILTTNLSAEYQSRSDVKETLMYAYGGKCGISFLSMLSKLKNVSSTKMFEFALQLFSGTTVDLTACDNAYTALASLGTSAQRTNNQNLFAAILGLTRMAAAIHAKMDTDAAGVGDGIVDVGWDSCEISSAVNRLSDSDVNSVVSGVGLVFENLTALGSALTSGTAGSAFESAKTLCETPINMPAIGTPQDYGVPGGTTWINLGFTTNSPTWVDFGLPPDIGDTLNCMNTDPSLVPDKMRRIFRRMISSSSVGFGTCDLANVTISVDTNVSPPQASVSSNCCPALVSP